MGITSEKDKKVREFLTFCRRLPKRDLERVINQLQLILLDMPDKKGDNIDIIHG